jgi:hypothetical protein
LTVFQPTTFVIWGGNKSTVESSLPIGTRVQFWGKGWVKQVQAGDYRAGDGFMGWAQRVTGTTWVSTTGDTKPPTSVASFISVIVTTHVADCDRGKMGDREKQGRDNGGSCITGNVAATAILLVESPASFDGKVGHPGFGTVVAILH